MNEKRRNSSSMSASRRSWSPEATVRGLKRGVSALIVGLVAFIAVAVLFSGTNSNTRASRQWLFVEGATMTTEDLGFVAHRAATSGSWSLEDDSSATGGRALANHAGDEGAAPALIIASDPRARDLRAHTRCRTTASCGVVFRFVDVDNHWLARVDVAKQTAQLVTVSGGASQIIGESAFVTDANASDWINFGIEVRGDVVRLDVNGRPALTASAPFVPAAFGGVGLWAPSHSAVSFDHLAIDALVPVPQALEVMPLLGHATNSKQKGT